MVDAVQERQDLKERIVSYYEVEIKDDYPSARILHSLNETLLPKKISNRFRNKLVRFFTKRELRRRGHKEGETENGFIMGVLLGMAELKDRLSDKKTSLFNRNGKKPKK